MRSLGLLTIAACLAVTTLPTSPRAQASMGIAADLWGRSSTVLRDGMPAETDLSRVVRWPFAAAPGWLPYVSRPSVSLRDQGTWSTVFHSDGMNEEVSAQAVYRDQLIIGGGFHYAGSVQPNHVIGWNGSRWSLLGTGTNDAVYSLIVFGDKLIVGGGFSEAGGIPAARIASWDGSQWNALGSGFDKQVHALVVYDGWLIAGGDFGVAGGISTRHIARWDGTHWEPLLDDSTGVDGVGGRVNALAVYHDELVVAGWFVEAGGVPCRGVARWNGASWQPLGTGVGPAARAEGLCVYGDELIVGGQFTYAGRVPVSAIASWDGASWHALGAGVGGIPLPLVRSLTVFDGDLIAGGMFPTAGDSFVSSIARWDGRAWHPVGGGVHVGYPQLPEVGTIAVYHDRLYAGGGFVVAGDTRANAIACWDGLAWAPLDPGLGVSGAILSLVVSESYLIAAGDFVHAGSRPANRIARLTQGHWEPLGEGTDGVVNAVLLHRGELVAGGEFLHAGGVEAHHVAAWDGAGWRPMGAGLDGEVYSLCAYKDTVIASGDFTGSGSTILNRVARWDGMEWLPLGGGMDARVRCVCVLRDTLYAGGRFEIADDAPARHVAYWTGATWKELGGGTDRNVNGLGSYDGKLVVGGTFWTAGTVAANRVALWDGEWHALGEGLDYAAFTFIEHQHSLYVGGFFFDAGGLPARGVARWDGSHWHTLGEGGLDWDGVNGEVRAFAVYEGGLYLGGPFWRAGTIRSRGIARWDGATAVAIQDFHVRREGGVVRLQWNLTDAGFGGDVFVERSSRVEGPYQTLVRLPVTGQVSMEYSDASADGSREWWYRLCVSTVDGDVVFSEPVGVSMSAIAGPSAIDGIDQRGDGHVVVRYHIAGSGTVPTSLMVYDVRGRLVETLEAGSRPPGAHVAIWTAASVARGVYFATLTTNRQAVSRKFVLQHP